ncbi:MAG: carboxypeptidase regulatory-like domain-containing protein [Candidatus Solibacter usitatus]|nr:carboxypeptidase regulatory-like domain-containing protein [Candidatus Solibacter usitatus]
MKAAVLFLCALPLVAAINGTVVNKTSGKPQAGVTVNLTKIGQGGMEAAGKAVSDAAGKFQLEADASSPYLVQAHWQGVSYNVQAPPGALAQALDVAIFDASSKAGAVQFSQHMILVETDGKDLIVNETVIASNPDQTTWNNPQSGTLRFFVPAEARANIMARATAPGGMPVEREAKQAGAGVYFLDFPIKPGETRFDLSYKMPAGSPSVLSGKVVHAPGPVRLVVPQGITVEGDGLAPLGNEPQTQAAIFEIKNAQYKITVNGTGSLRPAANAAAGAAAGATSEEDGPRIVEMQPPGYQREWKWALGLMLAVLALSFAAQWMKAPGDGSKPSA